MVVKDDSEQSVCNNLKCLANWFASKVRCALHMDEQGEADMEIAELIESQLTDYTLDKSKLESSVGTHEHKSVVLLFQNRPQGIMKRKLHN